MENNNNNIDPNTIRVATWNLAKDSDWKAMNQYHPKDGYKVKDRDGEALTEWRRKTILDVFKRVQPDIIFIQEAFQSDGCISLSGMKAVLPQGYVLKTGDGVDTAVAFKASAFEEISTRSPPVNKWGDSQGFYTISDLKHLETGHQVRAVSAHLLGTNETAKYINDADVGDTDLKNLVARVQKNSNEISLILWGLDANVEPTHPRIDTLRDAGYHLDDERVTAFNRFKAREFSEWKNEQLGKPPVIAIKLDYLAFLVKNKGLEVKSEFPKAFKKEVFAPVGDPRRNPSDHTILIRDVTMAKPKTMFQKLFG